ncbi:CHAT domain-containing protein [Novipirellula sp.]|uniref:CHAT domain-containing protein n=1 Tax=Novipirellula sp. TaxID=2795430 RepID=UPI00356B3DCA
MPEAWEREDLQLHVEGLKRFYKLALGMNAFEVLVPVSVGMARACRRLNYLDAKNALETAEADRLRSPFAMLQAEEIAETHLDFVREFQKEAEVSNEAVHHMRKALFLYSACDKDHVLTKESLRDVETLKILLSNYGLTMAANEASHVLIRLFERVKRKSYRSARTISWLRVLQATDLVTAGFISDGVTILSTVFEQYSNKRRPPKRVLAILTEAAHQMGKVHQAMGDVELARTVLANVLKHTLELKRPEKGIQALIDLLHLEIGVGKTDVILKTRQAIEKLWNRAKQSAEDGDNFCTEELLEAYGEISIAVCLAFGNADIALGRMRDAYNNLDAAMNAAAYLYMAEGRHKYRRQFAESKLSYGRMLRMAGESISAVSPFSVSATILCCSGNNDCPQERDIPLMVEVLADYAIALAECGAIDRARAETIRAIHYQEIAAHAGQWIPKEVLARLGIAAGLLDMHEGNVQSAARHLGVAAAQLREEFKSRPGTIANDFSTCLSLHAVTQRSLGNEVEAKGLYEEAIVMLESNRGRIGERVAVPLFIVRLAFAKFLLEAANPRESILQIDQAQKAVQNVDVWQMDTSRASAEIENLRGRAFVAIGAIEEACAAFRVAAKSWQTTFEGQFLEDRFLALMQAGMLCSDIANAENAFVSLGEADQLLAEAIEVSSVMRFRVVDPRKRLSLQTKVATCYAKRAVILAKLITERNCAELTETLVSVSEQARARVIFEMVSTESQPSICPDVLRKQLQLARAEVHNAASREARGHDVKMWVLAPVYGDSLQKAHSPQIDTETSGEPELQTFDESLIAYQAIVRTIKEQHDPFFNPTVPVETATLEDAVHLLPNDRTAILHLHVNESGLSAVVIKKGGHRFYQLTSLSKSRVTELGKRWWGGFETHRETQDTEAWKNVIDEITDALSERLLQPIMSEIGDCESIIIVPNRELHLFPFHAIPLGDQVRMCDLFDVQTVPSLSILKRLAEKPSIPGNDTLLLASNDCDDELAPMEVRKIAEVLTAGSCDPSEYTFEELTKRSQSSQIWHFAGHAMSNLLAPLDSVLRDGTRTDRLKLQKIFEKLRLPLTDVTTLSGCETAVLVPNDIDEYVSFPLAFHYAGSRTVVSCLWQVDQLACTLFFYRFYDYIVEGKTPIASVRLAQRWLRGEDDHRGESLRNGSDVLKCLEEQYWPLAEDKYELDEWKSFCKRYIDEPNPPFGSVVHWGAFTCSGLGWSPIQRIENI